MNFLSRLNMYLETACKVILVVLFIVMIITTFSQVVLRYLFSYSFSWSGELARYCLIWLTFVGGALGVRAKIHVAVEAVTANLPENIRYQVTRLNYFFIMLFSAVLVIYGYKLSAYNIATQQLSPSIPISIGFIYAAVPIGGILIFAFALELFLEPEKGGITQ